MWYIIVSLSVFWVGTCLFEGLTNIAKGIDNVSKAINKLINNNSNE